MAYPGSFNFRRKPQKKQKKKNAEVDSFIEPLLFILDKGVSLTVI